MKTLAEEFKAKQKLEYKIIKDSDQPSKRISVYEQTIHLVEE